MPPQQAHKDPISHAKVASFGDASPGYVTDNCIVLTSRGGGDSILAFANAHALCLLVHGMKYVGDQVEGRHEGKIANGSPRVIHCGGRDLHCTSFQSGILRFCGRYRLDPSGGALSGGVVTLTNVATCERRQTATRGSAKVTVSGTIRADISVQPGDVSQSVEVQEAVPLLRTEDPNPQCTTDGDPITGKNIFAAGNYRIGGGMAGAGRLASGELICKENR